MKPLHQTDIRDFALIDQAAYFVASVFLGTGQFDKSEQTNLADARTVARKMSTHYQNGRLGMVYAILPDGRSVFIPDAYQPKEKEMAKTYSKKSNAQRAAKKAGVDPASVIEVSAGAWGWADGDGMPAFLKKESEAMPKLAEAKGNGVSKERQPAVKTKKAKAAKVAKSPKVKAEKKARPATGARAAIAAAAAEGKLPAPPDFTAESHSRYRDKLAELVGMAKAGDVAGLKAFEIKTYSSSPKAMERYRNLAVTALEARSA